MERLVLHLAAARDPSWTEEGFHGLAVWIRKHATTSLHPSVVAIGQVIHHKMVHIVQCPVSLGHDLARHDGGQQSCGKGMPCQKILCVQIQ